MSRRYYGIENIGLTANQKSTLVDALRQLGANNQHPNPSHRNHWRVRLDNEAVIFEADWDVGEWTIDAMKQRLANIYDINPQTIGHATMQTKYGPIITFSRNGDKLRMVAFGGVDATYKDSHAAVLEYLSDNINEWEEPLEEPLKAPTALPREPEAIEVVPEPEPEPVPMVSVFGREIPLSSEWTWEKIIKPIRDWIQR